MQVLTYFATFIVSCLTLIAPALSSFRQFSIPNLVETKAHKYYEMSLLWVNASCCVVTMNKYKNSLFVTK
jgi:hypothetical protein